MERLRLLSKKGLLATTLSALILGFGVFGFSSVDADVIKDCTANSIITCGEQTPSDFVNAVKTGQNGKHTDLTNVYSNFGLVPGLYDQFVATAEDGTAYQNGTIVVNGQTVATDAWSIGRTKFSYTTPYPIDGKTYYKAKDTQVLLQNLPVMVMFNSKGQVLFAVMKACGNPVTGTPVTPQYSCKLLNMSSVSGQPNTYQFTTNASASDNAKVVRVVYDFGDGSNTVSVNSLSTPVTHTYTKPGNWTARVTVYVSLPGNQTVTVTSANCQKTISIASPYQSCASLNVAYLNEDQRKVQFTVTTNQGNGATLKNATFNFGDQSPLITVDPASPNTVVVNYTYANNGTYNFEATATVNFNTMTGLQSVSCVAPVSFTVPPVTPPPTPTPAPTPPSTPVKQLVNTGPGNVIGLFAGASVVGYIVYRFFLGRRLKQRS